MAVNHRLDILTKCDEKNIRGIQYFKRELFTWVSVKELNLTSRSYYNVWSQHYSLSFKVKKRGSIIVIKFGHVSNHTQADKLN